MKIAFVITRSDAMGGASVHVRDMARALNQSGNSAMVLVGGEGGEVTERLTEAHVPYHVVPQLRREIHPVRDAAAVLAVRAALKAIQPDLVSTHTAKAGLVGRFAARTLGLPVLYTPHGWAITDRISRRAGQVFQMAERAAAPFATRIINVCEAERELALQHGICAAERLDVVHNGVVDIAPRLRANPALEPARMTMVARFEAPKDHATLLQALAPLASLPWTLDLAGGGPLEASARALAEELGLATRVNFLGGGQAVAEVLSRSQMFVLATRSEGFPRSILEAMRAGLPVVASNAGGSSEAVAHGESGFMVPRGDAAALRQALQSLLVNPGLRTRFGARGRERYERHFTFTHMFEKTLAVYRAAVRSAASGAFESAAAEPLRRTL